MPGALATMTKIHPRGGCGISIVHGGDMPLLSYFIRQSNNPANFASSHLTSDSQTDDHVYVPEVQTQSALSIFGTIVEYKTNLAVVVNGKSYTLESKIYAAKYTISSLSTEMYFVRRWLHDLDEL